jgi:predicted flap endonuclease-1-like 5' DNA nuclease
VPALSLSLVLMLAAAFGLGAILGWMLRREKIAAREAGLAELRMQQLEAQQRKIERLYRQREELRTRVSETRDRYRARLREAREQAGDAGGHDETLRKLRDKLAESIERREALRRQLERLITRSRKLATDAARDRERAAALEDDLQTWRRKLPPLMARYRDKSRQASEFEARLRQLGEAPDAEPEAVHAAPAPPEAAADDLQRIRGIGPALERKLHAMGIYRLDQIAGFDADDIERVGQQLGAFARRIDRDGWVAQARDIIAQ